MTSAIFCASLGELKSAMQRCDCCEPAMHAPFAHYDWIISAIETLGGETEQQLLLVQDSGMPVALAAFSRGNRYFSAFEQIGVAVLGEPGEILFKNEECLRRLTDELAKKRMPLDLSRVSEKSPLVSAIRKSYRHSAVILAKPHVGCPYIALKATADETINAIPERMTKDLKRARKKAEAIGEVTLEMHSPTTPTEFEPLWQISLGIEAAGWKGKKGTSLKSDSIVRKFYKTYASRACKNGTLKFCFLCIDGQPIAMQFAVEQNNSFWLLKIGYNEEFSKCSPGMLLMLETIKYAARKNLDTYEFLGFASDWTRRWTLTERKNISVNVYPYTFQGMSVMCRDFLKKVTLKILTNIQKKNFKKTR